MLQPGHHAFMYISLIPFHMAYHALALPRETQSRSGFDDIDIAQPRFHYHGISRRATLHGLLAERAKFLYIC